MTRSASLLESVCNLIQRTYSMQARIPDIGRFVIGDQGYTRLYNEAADRRAVHRGQAPLVADPADDGIVRDNPTPLVAGAAAEGAGAKTLVRETAEGVRAVVYYPDALIQCLEQHPPQRGLDHRNVQAFATLVEELDHLLLIAERNAAHREVSLFELELHANVTKELVLKRFLAGAARVLSSSHRRWLRNQLFDQVEFTDDDPSVRARYRDAARWAVRLLDSLHRLSPRDRLGMLRQFHGSEVPTKLHLIRQLQQN